MKALALSATVLLLAAGCGGGRALTCTELPGEAVPVQPSPHLPTTESAHAAYATLPPTSGPHVPFTVAPGVYREPIDLELQVHALEHGHVLVQYAPGTPAVAELERIARRHPRDVVVAPYPGLGRGIAVTAWGRMERLARVHEERIERFVEALAGRYDHGWQDGAGACS